MAHPRTQGASHYIIASFSPSLPTRDLFHCGLLVADDATVFAVEHGRRFFFVEPYLNILTTSETRQANHPKPSASEYSENTARCNSSFSSADQSEKAFLAIHHSC